MKLIKRDFEGNDAWFSLYIVKISFNCFLLGQEVESQKGNPQSSAALIDSIEDVRIVLEEWMVDDIDGIIAELGGG